MTADLSGKGWQHIPLFKRLGVGADMGPQSDQKTVVTVAQSYLTRSRPERWLWNVSAKSISAAASMFGRSSFKSRRKASPS